MNNTVIKLSDQQKGLFGIVGHVGVGHVHSHSSFVQDDSAGFAVVASLMNTALQANTMIIYVNGDPLTGEVTVRTAGGGVGKTYARRGITPTESELMQRVINEDGIYTQKLAVRAFGRMYGQGVTEPPVALQGAIALAILDTFKKKAPDRVCVTTGKYLDQIDKMAGLVVDINGTAVSLLLNINGTDGGIGPNEDNEGNTCYGEKGEIMESIGLCSIPTIVVESKAYIPKMAEQISDFTFLLRAQEGVDNQTVAEAMKQGAEEYSIPYVYQTDALPMIEKQLANATADFADKVIAVAMKLKEADAAGEKVKLVGELAKLVSEDAGGVTFMTSSVHETVRSTGMIPGMSAVISLLVPTEYFNYWKIPLMDPYDVEQYKKIILRAIQSLERNKDEAYTEMNEKSVG